MAAAGPKLGAVLDGVQAIAFSIHDAAEGGAQLWSETQNVVVADGLFSGLLGTVTLLFRVVGGIGFERMAQRILSAALRVVQPARKPAVNMQA